MILLAIIAGVVVVAAVVAFAIGMRGIDCPRVVLGYNCKGKKCDHSVLAMDHARRTMGGL